MGTKTTLRLLAAAIGSSFSALAPAASVTLDFHSLPTAQGWSYWALNTWGHVQPPADNIFSVNGTALHQDSTGANYAPQGSNYLYMKDVVVPGKPFVVNVRARVTQEFGYQGNDDNHWGFTFGVTDGQGGAYGVGIGDNAVTVMAATGNPILDNFDGTVYHDYRLEGTPGEGGNGTFSLYIDNVLRFANLPVRYYSAECGSWAYGCNAIGLGDGTGGTNAIADVTLYSFIQPEPAIVVGIDVKPGSDENPINRSAEGTTPVAVLGSASFDAAAIDASSARFGASGVEAKAPNFALEDVNGDGRPDMVFHFETATTGLDCRHKLAMLTAKTVAGQAISGSEAVRVLGPSCR